MTAAMTTPVPKITHRELAVLEAIAAYVDEHGYQPTTRELAPIIGRSYVVIARDIAVLEALGVIRRKAARAIVRLFPLEDLREHARP